MDQWSLAVHQAGHKMTQIQLCRLHLSVSVVPLPLLPLTHLLHLSKENQKGSCKGRIANACSYLYAGSWLLRKYEFTLLVMEYPDELIEHLSDGLETLLTNNPGCRVILAGDINQLKLNTLMHQFSLSQLVKKPTRGNNTYWMFFLPTHLLNLVRWNVWIVW